MLPCAGAYTSASSSRLNACALVHHHRMLQRTLRTLKQLQLYQWPSSDAPCGADGHEPNVAAFLPRNTCLSGLAASLQGLPAPIDPVCLERNILNDQLKSVTLYLHALKQ